MQFYLYCNYTTGYPSLSFTFVRAFLLECVRCILYSVLSLCSGALGTLGRCRVVTRYVAAHQVDSRAPTYIAFQVWPYSDTFSLAHQDKNPETHRRSFPTGPHWFLHKILQHFAISGCRLVFGFSFNCLLKKIYVKSNVKQAKCNIFAIVYKWWLFRHLEVAISDKLYVFHLHNILYRDSDTATFCKHLFPIFFEEVSLHLEAKMNWYK